MLITEAVKLNLVTKAKELNYKVGSRVESGSSQSTELLQCTGLAQVYRKMSNCNSSQLLQVTTCRIETFFLSLKIKLYVYNLVINSYRNSLNLFTKTAAKIKKKLLLNNIEVIEDLYGWFGT